MPDKSKIANEWFERGRHDIEAARLLFDYQHYTDTIAHLIQQGVEKYLKGFLIHHGWKLKKIHDLEELVTEATKYNVGFKEYLDFARKVTAYYIDNRYPPGPPIDYPREDIEKSLKLAEEIIEKIKQFI